VQTEADERARWLRDRGVDPAGVDLDDLDAVVRAMHRDLPQSGPVAAAEKAHHFVPWGPPAEDTVAAEREIRGVFRLYAERSRDGRDLVNVQAGAGLAEPMSAAGQRVPRVTEDNVAFAVDALRFVCPDEAVVWFSLEVGGQPSPLVRGRRGRAVRVDGRWLVERGTIAELLTFAGVRVPPPPDPPSAEPSN
jgi:hypothetical protein